MRVTTIFDGRSLSIAVKDEGIGFEHEKTGGVGKNWLGCHGRGLAMIGTSVDHVEFKSKGNEIVMTKHLDR